jgi:hypothetical protein
MPRVDYVQVLGYHNLEYNTMDNGWINRDYLVSNIGSCETLVWYFYIEVTTFNVIYNVILYLS